MPLPAVIALVVTLLGGAVFVGLQIRRNVRDSRNLKRWERNEPIESDWND